MEYVEEGTNKNLVEQSEGCDGIFLLIKQIIMLEENNTLIGNIGFLYLHICNAQIPKLQKDELTNLLLNRAIEVNPDFDPMFFHKD